MFDDTRAKNLAFGPADVQLQGCRNVADQLTVHLQIQEDPMIRMSTGHFTVEEFQGQLHMAQNT